MRQSLTFKFSVASQPTRAEILKSNIVPGVSMVTIGPALGHVRYDERGDAYPVEANATTLAQVMACAQTYKSGLKVKDCHFGGFGEFAGRLQNFRIQGDQLLGDFEIFEAYPKRELMAEAIEKIPDTFGFSIDFSGPFEIKDGKALARCVEIYSCDVVDRPAANPRGMFDRAGDVMNQFWTEIKRLAGLAPAVTPTAPAPSTPAAPQPAALSVPAQPPAAPAPPAPAAAPVAPEPTIRDVMGAVGTLAAGLQDLNGRFCAANPAPATPATPAAPSSPAAPAAPAAPEAPRMTFEQLQQAAKAMGIQFAARAGVPPVEQPAGAAAPATTEKARDVWARQFAPQ